MISKQHPTICIGIFVHLSELSKHFNAGTVDLDPQKLLSAHPATMSGAVTIQHHNKHLLFQGPASAGCQIVEAWAEISPSFVEMTIIMTCWSDVIMIPW